MRFIIVVALLLCISGRLQAQQQTVVKVTNAGSSPFENAVVEIPWSKIRSAYPQVDTTQLLVVYLATGQEVPYQLERRGQKEVQNLLVQVSVAPKQTLQLALRRGKPAPVSRKTYCRYVPERFDDFAWENDRVAFRIYGAALNGRSDNAYGSDIWAKRTDQLILNKWYKSADYHKDHGEGLDYYHVGLTLGAGDIGAFVNDSIGYIHNYRNWTVLDNGPLRSTFRVTFDPYIVKGITVNQTKTISLDAGSQLSRVQVHVAHTSPTPLPMVVGITLRPEESPLLLDEQAGILGYWEPTHGVDGTIGVGCLMTGTAIPMLRRYQHGLAKLEVKASSDVVYYTGGAWDKAGLIKTSGDWFSYLSAYKNRVSHPLRVSVGR